MARLRSLTITTYSDLQPQGIARRQTGSPEYEHELLLEADRRVHERGGRGPIGPAPSSSTNRTDVVLYILWSVP
jgi:hypothetical protein